MENIPNIVPILSMLVKKKRRKKRKEFIDSLTPRKINVITSCKTTDRRFRSQSRASIVNIRRVKYIFPATVQPAKATPETAVVK